MDTRSCLTNPLSPLQMNAVGMAVAGTGLGVNVAGMGLGVKVTVVVEVEGIIVWVGMLSVEEEQAESPMRSARQVIR